MRARAACHPNREAKARGLCGSCYNRERFTESPQKHEKAKALIRACHRKNGPAYRERALEKRLGLTPESKTEILMRQGGVCAICGLPPKSSRWKKLYVDHDHKTNRVRGLLCSNCNTGLGLFQDSPLVLAQAHIYLKKFAV